MLRYFAIALVILSQPARGAEDCSQIADPESRLECFDRGLKVEAKSSEIDRPDTKQEPSGRLETLSTTSGPNIGVEPVDQSKDAGFKSSSIFRKRDGYIVKATVKEIMNKDRQKMVFLLSNEQIWLQSSPRSVPIRPGDEVVIKSGSIGGFILRNENGTSTRVRRIY